MVFKQHLLQKYACIPDPFRKSMLELKYPTIFLDDICVPSQQMIKLGCHIHLLQLIPFWRVLVLVEQEIL
jgi:hypothetical protein